MKATNRFSIHFKLRAERTKDGFAPVFLGLVVDGTKSYMALKNFQADTEQFSLPLVINTAMIAHITSIEYFPVDSFCATPRYFEKIPRFSGKSIVLVIKAMPYGLIS